MNTKKEILNNNNKNDGGDEINKLVEFNNELSKVFKYDDCLDAAIKTTTTKTTGTNQIEAISLDDYDNNIQYKRWGTLETKDFISKLKTHGTDFDLLEKLMPRRTKYELQLKFKKEFQA